MIDLLPIAHIFVALSLSGIILLQSQGTGLGTTFGGGGEFYRSKRGIERILFLVTIGLTVVFLVLSLLRVVSL